MEKKLEPIQLKKTTGIQSWMYVDKDSIEVFIHAERGKNPVSVIIKESLLKKLLESLV